MTLESSLSTRVPQTSYIISFVVPIRVQPHNSLCLAAKGYAGQRVQLNVSNLVLELLQLLLQIGVLLCHLFILLLPLVAFILQGLNLALEVAGLDISLSEPVIDMLARDSVEAATTYMGGFDRVVTCS